MSHAFVNGIGILLGLAILFFAGRYLLSKMKKTILPPPQPPNSGGSTGGKPL